MLEACRIQSMCIARLATQVVLAMPNPGLSNSNASGAAPKKDQQKNNKHRYGAISGSMVTMLLLDTVLARKHPHPNTSTHRPQEGPELQTLFSYLWLVGNGRMVVIVVIIVPHSSIPYSPKVSFSLGGGLGFRL